MTDRVLLVFDFDGVIVDGMQEYWWSASRACRLLPGGPSEPPASEVPERFRQLRPWVHHGWEMVLQAAEVEVLDPSAWIADYPGQRQKALQRRGWSVPQLQDALDRARADALKYGPSHKRLRCVRRYTPQAERTIHVRCVT